MNENLLIRRTDQQLVDLRLIRSIDASNVRLIVGLLNIVPAGVGSRTGGEGEDANHKANNSADGPLDDLTDIEFHQLAPLLGPGAVLVEPVRDGTAVRNRARYAGRDRRTITLGEGLHVNQRAVVRWAVTTRALARAL